MSKCSHLFTWSRTRGAVDARCRRGRNDDWRRSERAQEVASWGVSERELTFHGCDSRASCHDAAVSPPPSPGSERGGGAEVAVCMCILSCFYESGRAESLLDTHAVLLPPSCAELPAEEETSADPRHLRGAGSKQQQQQQQRGKGGSSTNDGRRETRSSPVRLRGVRSQGRIPRERNDPLHLLGREKTQRGKIKPHDQKGCETKRNERNLTDPCVASFFALLECHRDKLFLSSERFVRCQAP